jgi:para-aminobenzoate synthetase / 4-amino-4-deoxychorismate lyase
VSFKTIIYDSFENKWLQFEQPQHCFIAHNYSDILPIVDEIERHLDEGGYSAGYLSYDAAPAFDDAFVKKKEIEIPLCFFGIFEKPSIFTIPDEHFKNFAFHSIGNITKKEFDSSFSKIKSYIRQGLTYQVNYTHKEHFRFRGDPFSFFLSLIKEQPTPYAAYLETDEWAICSASPEVFFILNGENIICKPMKGTIARGKDPAADSRQKRHLQHSIKDKAENVMIVDMIRNDLSRIAEPGSVSVKSLYDVEPYSTLWQMTSTVEAKTDKSLSRILKALFPCASITGAPKIKTMQIIDELETEARNIYTGAIGLLKPDRHMQFSVAIRTALIHKNEHHMEYGIGSGIVWDSIADAEFDECQLKFKVISNTSIAFELLETMLLEPDTGYYLLDYHIERIAKSARYFGWPFDERKLREMLSRLLPVEKRFKVRLLLSSSGEIKIQKSVLLAKSTAIPILRIAQNSVHSDNIFLHHKTTHRSIYQAAQKNIKECDDIVLWNEFEQITETTICNIVLEKDNQMLTPQISAGLLPGTMRQHLLDSGIIEEAVLSKDDLFNCDVVYVINSVQGMRRAKFLHDDQGI